MLVWEIVYAHYKSVSSSSEQNLIITNFWYGLIDK